MVRYGAIADSSGSINSCSIGKTDFWQFADRLFLGILLTEGEGLAGFYMPNDNPQATGPQSMPYDGGARRPWRDLPRCQSCHTGDAVTYLTGAGLFADPTWPFRLRQAYRTGDLSASSLLTPNNRFAENTNTLYRFSKGHGNITCEGCHGSTHAEWPNAIAGSNDNLAAVKLQGYAGKIMECSACHRPGSLARTTSGPHGLHNINDARWYDDGHESFYENNKNSCKACHGLSLTGTPLSRVPIARSFRVDGQTRTFSQGAMVSCDKCHEMTD